MNVQELFNGEVFAKQVSGFGDLAKWEEVTEGFKTQWEEEHPVELNEVMVGNN